MMQEIAKKKKRELNCLKLSKQKKIDVIFIQETHSDVKNAADWMQEWDGISVLSHNTTLSGGWCGWPILFTNAWFRKPCSHYMILKRRVELCGSHYMTCSL